MSTIVQRVKIIPLTAIKMTFKLIKDTEQKICIRLFGNRHHEKHFNLLLSNVGKKGSCLEKKNYVFFMLHKHA